MIVSVTVGSTSIALRSDAGSVEAATTPTPEGPWTVFIPMEEVINSDILRMESCK